MNSGHAIVRALFFAALVVGGLSWCVQCQFLGASEFEDCNDLAIPEDMRCIPGGPFVRGSERASPQEDHPEQIVHDEAPVARIVVSTFLMDRDEVTYGQYQQCVQAGACRRTGPNYSGYSAADQPMLGANWFDARDYCRYRGRRLPTEAEWEKAARGTEGELFPWGNEPATCERAIIKEGEAKGCGRGVTWPVGSRPGARYGLNDMAGNSWEWVLDWYSESYGVCGTACSGRDPRGPCGGAEECPGHDHRRVRGGSWWWGSDLALGSNRRPHFPANQPFHHFGFRCARDARPAVE